MMKERHHRARMDYHQQFCRKRFLLLLLDLWTSFVWFILKASLRKEIWREKSSGLGVSYNLFLYHPKHHLQNPTYSCITTHSRKCKLPSISRNSYNNIMMEDWWNWEDKHILIEPKNISNCNGLLSNNKANFLLLRGLPKIQSCH